MGCIFVFYNTAVADLSIEWNEQIRRRNGKGLEEVADGSPLKKEHKIVQIPIDLLSLSVRLRFPCENIQGLPLSMKVVSTCFLR